MDSLIALSFLVPAIKINRYGVESLFLSFFFFGRGTREPMLSL